MPEEQTTPTQPCPRCATTRAYAIQSGFYAGCPVCGGIGIVAADGGKLDPARDLLDLRREMRVLLDMAEGAMRTDSELTLSARDCGRLAAMLRLIQAAAAQGLGYE